MEELRSSRSGWATRLTEAAHQVGGWGHSCMLPLEACQGQLILIAPDRCRLAPRASRGPDRRLRPCSCHGMGPVVMSLPQPWPAYCLSKAVLNAATRILGTSTHTRAQGLAVTAVCPGDVLTGARSRDVRQGSGGL